MAKYIDFHVHILGNGRNGSGCWMNLRGRYRLLGELIVRHLGLPPKVLFEDLEEQYAAKLIEWVRSSPLDAVVLLAHEDVYEESGARRDGFGCFYVPNSYVLELAARHSEFIAAVSIHPARRDALDELERCIALGARVMKCLPNCQNINCSDPRYKKFWQRMSDAGMVLLSHTGGEQSVPVANRAYQNPEILRLPLECGVKVVAAHSATSSGFWDTDYTEVFRQMLREHSNLYGDNSALNSPFRSRHLRTNLEPEIASRVVHGSDLPIPISGLWGALRGVVPWRAYREAHRDKNLLARDYLLKRAMGYPERSFTLGGELLNL